MIKAKHCELCDNKIVDFKTGIICSLTNKKPDFTEKCNTIKLEENFKNQITEKNIKYEAILKTKASIFFHLILYLSAAILLTFGGIFIGEYALSSGVISTIPIIIIGTGIFPLGLAFGPLNNYVQSLKVAKQNKNNIDHIASLYGYNYDIKIVHPEDSLGNKSYDVDLKLRRTNNQYNN